MNKVVSRSALFGLSALAALAVGCGQPMPEDVGGGDYEAMLTEEGIIFKGDINPQGITAQALSGVLLDVFNRTNTARGVARSCGGVAKAKVGVTTQNDKLSLAAQKHSDSMATNNFFSHTGLDGSDPGTRITREGYVWSTYGENIAAGYSTAQQVVDGWLASAGHCNNIMNGAFKQQGVGMKYTTTSTYKYYWTQAFATPR